MQICEAGAAKRKIGGSRKRNCGAPLVSVSVWRRGLCGGHVKVEVWCQGQRGGKEVANTGMSWEWEDRVDENRQIM